MTMLTPTDQPAVVNQADRNAAADQQGYLGGAFGPEIRRGEYDAHYAVQQFARHRLAHSARPDVGEVRSCTCHPDDRPAGECREKFAASECQAVIAGQPRCSICGGKSFAAIDVRQFDGTYAPGPERRCIGCKTLFTAQTFAALSAAMGEVGLE